MSDRMSLSIKKQWFDNENRAYIYFSIEDIMELFLRLIGRIVLIPVWIVWLLIGAAADTLIGVAYAVKGMIGFVLTVQMAAVVIVNRDCVQGLFLLCLNSGLFVILFFGVLECV